MSAHFRGMSVSATVTEVLPTSTWVVFEEAKDPPSTPVFDSARVPQADSDIAGPFYFWYSGSGMPGQEPKRFEHAGRVFDACKLEDAFFGINRRFPGAAGPSSEFKREWFRYNAPTDCRGFAEASVRPLLGSWPGRYFTYDNDGKQSPYVQSLELAEEWYAENGGLPSGLVGNTIPRGAGPAGMGSSGSLRSHTLTGYTGEYPWIHYSDAEEPVDAVRVLTDTVVVADGVLRGLVRNWSRTLWAYGTVVRAGESEWAWPLSVQPGEAAPFEIEGWEGPTEAAMIDFAVNAEMSSDADLSRAWWLGIANTPTPGGWHYFWRNELPSHPSLNGLWAPEVELDIALYTIQFDSDGAILDVQTPRLIVDGRQRDFFAEGEVGDDAPRVGRYLPGRQKWVDMVSFRFSEPSESYWVAWIGSPHARADQ